MVSVEDTFVSPLQTGISYRDLSAPIAGRLISVYTVLPGLSTPLYSVMVPLEAGHGPIAGIGNDPQRFSRGFGQTSPSGLEQFPSLQTPRGSPVSMCWVFSPARQSSKISSPHHRESQCVIQLAIRQQPCITRELGTMELQLQTTIKIDPQRGPFRFTHWIPRCLPLSP